eukprot:gb/GECG01016746.1/.p1 GENE.gb/GECG01016746.1/~~gb/GECG01016746.1/.p1  ORF type:complete len:612 (+),score=69.95 gb/GECG01016746.1/:1-1836(+)
MHRVATGSGRPRAAIVGAGAAGLVTARYLKDVGFDVTVFERSNKLGGLWNYTDDIRDGSVMYKSLRTNLPKEIMELRDHGFNPKYPSFVTHQQVASYLRTYAQRFELDELIRFQCQVDHIVPKKKHASSEKASSECMSPIIPPLLTPTESKNRAQDLLQHSMTVAEIKDSQLEDYEKVNKQWNRSSKEEICGSEISWELKSSDSNGEKREYFDYVAVCNGHYFRPTVPSLSNDELFSGRMLHSAEYRTPGPYHGKTVLIVGAGPSGADIGHEIAEVADRTYIAVKECDAEKEEKSLQDCTTGSLLPVSPPKAVDPDSRMLVTSFGNQLQVDSVIWCTGYSYDFPFLDCIPAKEYWSQSTPRSSWPLLINQDKRIHPLYLQLFHAMLPSLAFVGIPWRVNPLPFFECQAEYVSKVWSGEKNLPKLSERLDEICRSYDYYTDAFAMPLRYTHMLGPLQWLYCRDILSKSGHTVPERVELPGYQGENESLTEAELPSVRSRVIATRPPWPKDDTITEEYFPPNHELTPGEKVTVDHDMYVHTAEARKQDPTGYRSINFEFRTSSSNDATAQNDTISSSMGASQSACALEFHPGWMKTYPESLVSKAESVPIKDI